VLKLSLKATSYDWEFIPIPGKTFTDVGSGECHGPPPPTAKPGGPYNSEAIVRFDGSGSSDPSGLPIGSYSWDFGDGTTGTGATPQHTYSVDGTYTVTLTVTSAGGIPSAPVNTTVKIGNLPPLVQPGLDEYAAPGALVDIAMLFSDPNPNDGPWSWTLDWGDGSSLPGSAVVQGQTMQLQHTYAAIGTYTVRFTVTDKDGASATGSLKATISTAPAPPAILIGAGDIAYCGNDNDEKTAAILDTIPGTVFTLGDMVYDNGTPAEWANCYGPTWGRHKARTRPAVGGHEYGTSGATATWDYWGPALGERGKGYYSYDLGAWHVIVLNSQISMIVGSPQEQWLRADLAARSKTCTLAYWHNPLFSSGSDDEAEIRTLPLVQALYDFGVEIIMGGDAHNYERFTPQTPQGVADLERGIRAFVVGTGGRSLSGFGAVKPNSEVRLKNLFGLLKLTLSAGAYQWQYVQTGGVIGDSGTGVCH
jgi:PKD repeat protein